VPQYLYIGPNSFQATFSTWGNSTWFELDVDDPNFRTFVDDLAVAKFNGNPVYLVFHCCGTNGTYHIDAIMVY